MICEYSIEPRTPKEALQSPHKDKWIKSMGEEYQQHIKYDTFDIVDTLPPNTRVLPTKWVYKLKRNEDGEITRFKSRWVAVGTRQIHGIHYDDTYAAVIRLKTSRAIIAYAVQKGLGIYQARDVFSRITAA